MTRTATQHHTEELVFAIVAVDGATRVGRSHPDLEMAAVLSDYWGSLAVGPFGPPGDERFDMYGSALNQLFKAPAVDFFITPELRALVE